MQIGFKEGRDRRVAYVYTLKGNPESRLTLFGNLMGVVSINFPTLLLYGAKDSRVRRGEIDEVYKNLNGEKTLEIMDKLEHEIYLNDDSKKWNMMIDSFLKLE